MDPLTLVMLGVLALFIFLTWRSGRKRKQEAELAKTRYVPGAEIVTFAGIYGTIKQVEGDIVHLEVAPKVVIRIVIGAIARLATPEDPDAPRSVEEAMARAEAELAEREAAEAAKAAEKGTEKPAAKPAKSTRAELNVDHAIRHDEPAKKPTRKKASE